MTRRSRPPGPRPARDGCVIARPFGVPGRRHAGLVPRRRADHRRSSPPRSSARVPGSARGGTPSRCLRACCSTSRSCARAEPHRGRAARPACRCAGSACTCSAACRRSSGRRDTPGREAGIAVAGPLVSLLVAALAFGARRSCSTRARSRRLLAAGLMLSNLLVGVFNLLPGLPLDGGRVLSAAVWRATGPPAHRHRRRRLGRPGRRRGSCSACRSCVAPGCRDAGLARRRGLGGAARRRSSGSGASQAILPGRGCSSGCPAVSAAVADPAGHPGAGRPAAGRGAAPAPHEAGARGLVVVDARRRRRSGSSHEARGPRGAGGAAALGAGRRPEPPARSRR